MAKGNDGNYLQHSVEVALALHLASLQPEGRLHIALTHGMAPFEPSDWEATGQVRSKLRKAVSAAHASPSAGESSVVAAYRSSGARLSHYPNSAELLRTVLGTASLTGGITERDEKKYLDLQQAWRGTDVETRQSSWRSEVSMGGILACPRALDTPWLFSMDPMSYTERRFADDAYVYPEDGDRLGDVLGGFVKSGQPGVAALFVYAVKTHEREKFWAFVDGLSRPLGTTVVYCWLTHRGGNRNLAGLLCAGFELPDAWVPYGVHAGRC